MQNQVKIPDWALSGPEDLEYRTYKMLSHASNIRGMLQKGLLWDALLSCDEVLDFMYHYDAERLLEYDTLSTKLTIIDWENIESVYTKGEQVAGSSILDDLIDHAIDVFEGIHAEIREYWRIIERDISISQAGNRPYFVSDGFVFVLTPDNKIHIYSFKNPKNNFDINWRNFKLDHISTENYDKDSVIAHVAEIKSKGEDKIVYRVNIKTDTRLEGGPINVISSTVFMQLRKDYGF